jgi:hypothetical protein
LNAVHGWVIQDIPPADTPIDNLKWLLKDFLEVAYQKGALKTEITRMVKVLCEDIQYEPFFVKYNMEQTAELIFDGKIDLFFENNEGEKTDGKE